MSLPKSFNLAEAIPSLPEGSSGNLVSVRPVSGSSFTPSSIIDFDLPSGRGWLDPTSLAIRYKATTVADASGCVMIGCPLYTPFARLQLTVGGVQIDSISQYNQVCQVLVNGKYDVAGKYGKQSGFGYTNASAGNTQYLDGRLSAVSATDNYFVAGELPCILSNSEKMIPLFACGTIRLSLTLDTLANMFFSTGATYNVASSFAISNIEVVFNLIDLGKDVQDMVKGMGPRLFLKSHSYNNSATACPVGTQGSMSYVFNQRYSSIRSAFVCANRVVGSKWGEIVDLTSGAGDLQLQIGSMNYPSSVLSCVLNDSGCLQETQRAFNNLYSGATMSINTTEWSVGANTLTSNLSYFEPGKGIFGVNLEKCQSTDHVMMSGVSTYNSPINVVINCPTATTYACNLNLILDYDAIIVIDQEATSLSVRS